MNAILAQFVIVNVMLLTATFQAVVNYVQFSLTLCSTLTVFGVFVLRWRQPDLPQALQSLGLSGHAADFSRDQHLDA